MRGYLTNTSIGAYGRFANGVYQVAALIGIARKNGMQPVFPLWQNKDHKERFGSAEDIEIYKHLLNELPPIPEGVHFNNKPVEWGYHDMNLPAGNWNISGHFQSFRYFEHCADEVRFHMKMHSEKLTDVCAIHYRAGDYQHGQHTYHPRMPLEYYERAIENFPADQKYLMFSDDRDEAERICKDLRIDFDLSTGKDYIEDFKQMKGCRHFIIANSSYSAIAAWLSEWQDKKVISPSGYNWFGLAAEINGNDIPHESWTQVRFEKRKEVAA